MADHTTNKGALEDCVARKIPRLMHEGYDQEQAVAVAYSMCREKALDDSAAILAWGDMSDHQRAWWFSTMADIKAAEDTAVTTAPPQPLTVIKRLGEGRVGGYGIVWGSPEQRDLEGQYFTTKTYLGNVLGVPNDMMGKTFKAEFPWLFDHTLQDLPDELRTFDDLRDYEVGVVDTAKANSIGMWIEAQLKRHDDWARAVMTLVDRGVLAWSSGSAPLYAKIAPDGEITAWPVVEWSSTPTPAEPRNTTTIRLKHYVNHQDTPDEAPADEAARGTAPDHSSQSDEHMEATKAMELNELTARAVVRAYATAEFDAIKSAVEGLDTTKQGNMIEEALRPLAGQLAEMAGVEEGIALAELVAFVAANAMEAEPAEEMPMEEEPVMSDNPTLSTDVQKTVDAAVAKAMEKLVPESFKGQARTSGGNGNATKSFNINLSRSRHDITEIKSMGDLIYALAYDRHELLGPYRAKSWRTYKALGINPDTAGGYLVPVEQSNEVIELLRDTAKVLPLCRTIPMNSDTIQIPRQTGGATAYWVGENASITASQETFGQITLVAQKLAAMVQISNELIMDSDPAIEALVREDIARVLALEVDRVILEGSGAGNQPTGLLNLGCTTTALNAAPTYANLVDAVSRVEVQNVAEDPTWAWVFNPREKYTFRQIQDAQGAAAGVGAYIFTEMGSTNAMVGGVPAQLLGYPFATTTQITASGANSETEIYFGQWNDVVVGMRKTLELRASDEAGNAFQYDQTWIRAIMRVDVNIRHLESIEVLTDVRTS